MNILVVSRSLPFQPGAGGMEAVAWDLARAFTRRGHAVIVITATDAALPAPGQMGQTIEGVEIRTVASPTRYSPAWWLGTKTLFDAGLRGWADVVFGISAGANGLVASRRPGQAFIFQAHGTSSGEFMSKLRSGRPGPWVHSLNNLYWGVFKDAIYQRYDTVVAIGEAVNRQLTHLPTRILVGKTPIRLIPNGVDVETFAFSPKARADIRTALGLPMEAQVALSMGRLDEQKGVHVGLETVALALAEEPMLYYVIVGEGPQRGPLEAQAKALGLADRVIFTGIVERSMLKGYLSAADVFLFPTLRVEGLPMVFLEALAAGLPVVTTPNGGDADLPATRIAANDPSATAKALLGAFKAPVHRGSRLPRRYTLDQAVDDYLSLFEQLLSDPKILA